MQAYRPGLVLLLVLVAYGVLVYVLAHLYTSGVQ